MYIVKKEDKNYYKRLIKTTIMIKNFISMIIKSFYNIARVLALVLLSRYEQNLHLRTPVRK